MNQFLKFKGVYEKYSTLVFFVIGLLATSAFGHVIQMPLSSDCTENPDMFFTIDAGLGNNVTITEFAGYAGVNICLRINLMKKLTRKEMYHN